MSQCNAALYGKNKLVHKTESLSILPFSFWHTHISTNLFIPLRFYYNHTRFYKYYKTSFIFLHYSHLVNHHRSCFRFHKQMPIISIYIMIIVRYWNTTDLMSVLLSSSENSGQHSTGCQQKMLHTANAVCYYEQQELSYRKQTVRQLHTQYINSINSKGLRVTHGHWKRNH